MGAVLVYRANRSAAMVALLQLCIVAYRKRRTKQTKTSPSTPDLSGVAGRYFGHRVAALYLWAAERRCN